jgi:phosphatidylglycerophosphate synthase
MRVAALLLRPLAALHPHPRFGWGNRITLLRAGLAAGLLVHALGPAPFTADARWLIAAIGLAALALDGLDGWAARRQRLVSRFGARFDIETDALMVLVLSLLAIRAAAMPVWVIAIGASRYLYLVAAAAIPALRAPPRDSAASRWRRRLIGAAQSLALTAAIVPATPPAGGGFACAAALGLLIYSFAADAAIGLARDAQVR